LMEESEEIYEKLEYISDRNLILFYSDEFVDIYNGASGYEELPKGVHETAIKQGLLTRHYYPSKQRLTDKAIKILREHELLNKQE